MNKNKKILPEAHLIFQTKYGYDEAIFLTSSIKSLKNQIEAENWHTTPYDWTPMACTNIVDLKKKFPFWTRKKIMKILESLQKKNLIRFVGETSFISYFIKDHETLLKEFSDVY